MGGNVKTASAFGTMEYELYDTLRDLEDRKAILGSRIFYYWRLQPWLCRAAAAFFTL